MTGTCTAQGCDRPRSARGYCDAHYTRLRRAGTLDGYEPRRHLPEAEVIRLRRQVGLDDDGPTDADRQRWHEQEASR